MALIKGKQIADNTIANSKLVETYTNSNGTVAFTGNQSMGNNKLTNLANGTDANDAVNYSQLQSVSSGLSWKDSVRIASAGTVADLSSVTVADFDGQGQGITLVEGDRVLVKDTASPDGIAGASGAYNGIYVVGTVGAGSAPLTRSDDADTAADILSAAVFVEEGTGADTGFVMTTDAPITIDTTVLSWTQFTGAGQINAGAGLSKNANTINAGDANKGVQVNTDDLEIDASEIAGDGLQQNATNSWEIEVELEADGGIQFDGVNRGLEVKPDGTTGGDTAPVTVGANGVGLDVTSLDGDHLTISWNPTNYIPDSSPSESADVDDLTAHLKGIDDELAAVVSSSPVPTTSDKNLAASATTIDGDQAMASTVTTTPLNDSYVGVRVNGVHYVVGDGVKTTDCYFSGDSGTTARSISAIVATDTLHWNGSVSGFQLETSDRIDLDYDV